MAIALTSNHASNNSATTSVSVASGQGWATPTTGNLLVANVMNNQGSISTMTGWTNMVGQAFNSSGVRIDQFWKISDGTESTVTSTRSGASVMQLWVGEIRGNTATPNDATGNASTTSNTVNTISNTSTPSAAFGIYIAAWAQSSTVTWTNTDSSFTDLTADSQSRLNVSYKNETTIVTETPKGTWSPTRFSGGVLGFYLAAPTTINVSDTATTSESVGRMLDINPQVRPDIQMFPGIKIV